MSDSQTWNTLDTTHWSARVVQHPERPPCVDSLKVIAPPAKASAKYISKN